MKNPTFVLAFAIFLSSCTKVVLYEDRYLVKSFEHNDLKDVCTSVSKNLGIGVRTDTLSVGYITNVDETAGSTYKKSELRAQAIEDSRRTLAVEKPDVIVNKEMTLKWANDSVLAVKHLLPNYLSGHNQNDLYMSCVVQEYQLRNGIRSSVVNKKKSSLIYTGALLISPVLGIGYLSMNNPLYPAKETVIASTIMLAFEGLSYGIYFSKPSKDFNPKRAGIACLVSFRAMLLFGLMDVAQYNKVAGLPYDIKLMYRDKLPQLGIELTK